MWRDTRIYQCIKGPDNSRTRGVYYVPGNFDPFIFSTAECDLSSILSILLPYTWPIECFETEFRGPFLSAWKILNSEVHSTFNFGPVFKRLLGYTEARRVMLLVSLQKTFSFSCLSPKTLSTTWAQLWLMKCNSSSPA